MTPRALPGVSNSGGADKFLDFLNQELKPFINGRYRTNHYDMLAGHSFGGLLAMYSLIVEPNAYEARFAFSPSLRFLGPELVSHLDDRLSDGTDEKLFLYLNVGDEQERVVEAFRAVTSILKRGSEKLIWEAFELTGETHFTTPVIGQFQAFRSLFNGWKLTLATSRNGAQAVKEFYDGLSDRVGL